MELVPYGEDDFELTVAMETDPEVMSELGGPVNEDSIRPAHERRTRSSGDGDWWFTVVPESGGPAAGTIGVWPSEGSWGKGHEVGWMMLPAFQGRGLATQALGLLVDRVRAAPSVDEVHAFPGATNAPSNALCRSAGFELVGTYDADFRGTRFPTNHWVLDTRA